MAHLVNLKGQAKTDAKRQLRKTSSGRKVKLPSHLLTSEDEPPASKKSRASLDVKAELGRLRALVSKKVSQESEQISVPKRDKVSLPTATSVLKTAASTSRNIIETENMRSKITPTSDENDKNGNLPTLSICAPIPESTSKENIHSKRSDETCNLFPSAPDSALKGQQDSNIVPLPNSDDYPVEKEVLRILQVIVNQNNQQLSLSKQIVQELQNRNRADEVQYTNSLYEPLEGFPLKTVQEFHELNDAGKKTMRQKLHQHLVNLGGTKVKEFLNCALKQIMTDELVCRFTWLGDTNSEKFGNTKVAQVLYISAQKCPLFKGPDSAAEFKTEMLDVLRVTKQRYRNALKKTEKGMKPRDENANYEELLRRIDELEERERAEDSEVDMLDSDELSENGDEVEYDVQGLADDESEYE